MKTILKRKQDISALHPFKPKSTQQQQQNSGHQRQSFAPHNQQQPLNSSLAFATQNNSAPIQCPINAKGKFQSYLVVFALILAISQRIALKMLIIVPGWPVCVN
jgi:hypothetical protein